MTDKKKTPKAATKKTSTTRKSRAKKATQAKTKPSKLKRFSILALKLGAGLLVALALYLIYLDSKISHKFEGNKW